MSPARLQDLHQDNFMDVSRRIFEPLVIQNIIIHQRCFTNSIDILQLLMVHV